MTKISGPQLRGLRAQAQRLDPLLRIGKAGLTGPFFAALDAALDRHELVKVKFDHLKDQKKTLVPQIVDRSGSQLILRVGNVAVLYRQNPEHARPTDQTQSG